METVYRNKYTKQLFEDEESCRKSEQEYEDNLKVNEERRKSEEERKELRKKELSRLQKDAEDAYNEYTNALKSYSSTREEVEKTINQIKESCDLRVEQLLQEQRDKYNSEVLPLEEKYMNLKKKYDHEISIVNSEDLSSLFETIYSNLFRFF